MKSALIISTYNWSEALELVLQSVLIQTQFPNEIIVADDGSNNETKLVIQHFSQNSHIPIHHVWQEDIGYRKSKILNKAIAQAHSEYIIQVDGDCIMHRKFIEDHLREAKIGVYLYGSRVNVLPNFVSDVFLKKKIIFNFFSKDIKNRTRGLYLPLLSKLYKKKQRISKKFRGCNVSFWFDDFIAINGYNEEFEGWGSEDSDMVIRLGHNGVKAKRLRYVGIIYHIYHKANSKDKFVLNNEIQNETISKKIVRISNGIDKYLKNK